MLDVFSGQSMRICLDRFRKLYTFAALKPQPKGSDIYVRRFSIRLAETSGLKPEELWKAS